MPEDLVPAGGDSGAEVAGPGVPPAASQSAVERMAERAREFSLRGFKQFFYLTNRAPITQGAEAVNLLMPRHLEDGARAAIEAILSDRPVKEVVWEWSREYAKSTGAASLAAWLLGHRPNGTVCVFHASEESAQEIAESIAERVGAPLFRLVFPHVEPDKPRGWGAGGHEVKRTDVPYEVWLQEASVRTTPSIVGLGIYSTAIRGKRATLLILADDVTSDEVSMSEKELREAGRRFDEAIIPLATESALTLVVGTPQAAGDIIDVQKNRGMATVIRVPMWADEEAGITNWPEWWSKERALARKIQVGDVSWARNYLLDLKRASDIPLRYYTVPHDGLNPEWVAASGVDYASQMAATSARPGRSNYARADLLKRPTGGVAVYDGVVGQFPQEDGEFFTEQAQKLFPNFRGTVIEAIGKGEEHFNTMMRRHGLKLVPYKSHRKSKPDRLVMDLGPYLQRGALVLSDADTPFLNTARRFADKFPNVTNDDAGWDVWDAIYLACTIMIDGLGVAAQSDSFQPKLPKPESPWGKLAHSKL